MGIFFIRCVCVCSLTISIRPYVFTSFVLLLQVCITTDSFLFLPGVWVCVSVWSGVGCKLDDYYIQLLKCLIIVTSDHPFESQRDSSFFFDSPFCLYLYIPYLLPFSAVPHGPSPPFLFLLFFLLLNLSSVPQESNFLRKLWSESQDELAESFNSQGYRWTKQSERCPIQLMHCWPGDMPNSFWESLETGENNHSCSCMQMHTHYQATSAGK